MTKQRWSVGPHRQQQRLAVGPMALAAALCALPLGCGPTVRHVVAEDEVARLRRDTEKVQFAIRTTKRLIARARGAKYLPDLYNRLAELYVEQARYQYQIAYEKSRDRSVGVVSVQARLLKNQAIATWRRLLALFPDYPEGDKVTFFMGHEMRELGEYQEMLRTYEELADKYPKSQYRLEGLLVMGDYYFDKAQLDQAEKYYRKVIASPESRVHAMARYKLAWCRINRADFKGSLKLFEGAITAARKWLANTGGRSGAGSKIDLRREALVDSVFCYTEVHKPENSLTYFRKRADSKTTYLAALAKLGNRYYVKRNWKATAPIYREILRLSGDAEDALEYAHRLYESVTNGKVYDKGGADVEALITVIRRRYYNHATTAKTRKTLRTTFEKYTRDIATRLQALANERKETELHLRAARAYRAYLAFFGKNPRAPEMRQNLAETLYAAKDFMEAGHYYELSAKTLKGKERQEAIYTAVASYFEALKGKQATALSRLQVVQGRAGLRRAGRVYIHEFPRADNIRQVKFNIARTYYDSGEFEHAIRLFTAFVDQFTTSKEAPVAAHLVLDAYRSREDYDGLIVAGRAFTKMGSLGGADFKQEVAQIVKGAEEALLRTETIKAGEGGSEDKLGDIARKYRGTALGEKALLNKFVSARNGNDPEVVFETGEEFLRSYPASKQLGEVLEAMGKVAMDSLQFSRAATYLEAAARRKGGDQQIELLKITAALRVGLGDRTRAERALNRLLRSGMSAKDKGDLATKVVRLHVQAGDWSAVVGLLQRASAAGAASAELSYLLGYALFRQGSLGEAQSHLSAAVETGRDGDDDARGAAAAGQFYLAEISFKTFEQIQLSNDLSQLAGTLKQKLAAMVATRDGYRAAVGMRDAVWSVAALGRLASVDEKAAAALRSLKLPDGLPQGMVDQVKQALESNAAPLAKEAKEAIKQCAATARKVKVLSAAAKDCLAGRAPGGDPQAGQRPPRINRSQPSGAAGVQRALAKSPRDMKNIVRLGKLYLGAGDPYMARITFGKGLEIRETATLLNLLGVAAARLGEEQDALALFDQALKQDSGHAPARVNKAALLARFGYTAESKAEASRVNKRSLRADDPALLPGALSELGGV